MSTDLRIEYKEAGREPYSHPFSTARVLRECWWPLDARLGLATLARIDCLWITDRAEAARFAAELRTVREYLGRPGQREVAESDAGYMLGRLAILLPVIEQAVAEWDEVRELSV